VILTVPILTWASAAPAQAQSSTSSSWEFKATLYLWAAGLDGAYADSSGVGGPINSSFGDLLKNLSLGGMANFRAKKEAWGLSGDFIFMKLDATSPGLTGDVDVGVDMILAEADLTFGLESLHFLVGGRLLNVDQSLDFPSGRSESGSTTIVDPVLGAIGDWELGKGWTFKLRGDVGGFGVGSELTYQVLYGFGWQFANHWSLDFGYRVIGYDIKKEGVNLDIVMHGLIAGVGFNP
jgi:hypothetical protein